MVSLKWSNDALEDLAHIDTVIAQRIVAKAQWLEKNFTDIMPEKLHRDLKGLYKLRVGDYRVVYSVCKDTLIAHSVGHRRDIYK